MSVNLPTDLLRSFCAIADAGGFARAAERVHRSQAAVSLQIRRLEEIAGAPLFRREGRRMVLSEQGEILLGYARRILALNDQALAAVAPTHLSGPLRLGIVQDFAETGLPGILARFAHLHPDVRIEATVGRSTDLLGQWEKSGLDLALTARDANRAHRFLLPPQPMRWIGPLHLDLADPLPLVLLDAPCPFRDAAIAALNSAGRSWRIVYTSPSLSGLRAALRAGLGMTCRTDLMLEDGLRLFEAGLPPLPVLTYGLYGGDNEAAARLAEVMRSSLDPAAPFD